MIKVMQVGMGPIGQRVVSYLAGRKGLALTSAVDTDTAKIGQDVGDIAALPEPMGVAVSGSLDEALAGGKPDVAVLTTVSSFAAAAEQIEPILAAKIPVVSTCEEMAYPWLTHGELAKALDAKAKGYGVAVLGTGVNPGFLMDYLPLSLSAVCQQVEKVTVRRIQDASFRRIPFQQKIGAGLTLDEFEAKKATGTLRHVGLTESIHMIADRFGWALERSEDVLTPIVAEKTISSGYREVSAGMAAGVQQIGRGWVGGEEKITLLFRAAVGQANPEDTIEISGTPRVCSSIPGGVNGDVATCAITINAIRAVTLAPAGLRTMADCPGVSYYA